MNHRPMPIKIGESLGPEHYERIAKKVGDRHIGYPYWCSAEECACMGCMNRVMTWAEYECFKKYYPGYDKVTRVGSAD